MRHVTKYRIAGLAVLFGGILMAQGVLAEPDSSLLSVPGNGPVESGIGSALSSGDLEQVNGRKDVDVNIKEVSGIFSSTEQKGFLGMNTIEASHGSTFATGSNTIAEGAFANMNGIATVIQNSGNQVLIQNATVLDVIVK